MPDRMVSRPVQRVTLGSVLTSCAETPASSSFSQAQQLVDGADDRDRNAKDRQHDTHEKSQRPSWAIAAQLCALAAHPNEPQAVVSTTTQGRSSKPNQRKRKGGIDPDIDGPKVSLVYVDAGQTCMLNVSAR